jgi:hypothetical protein
MKMTDFMFYLLKSAACLALFYFGYWLFLKKETFFCLNRIYLVLSLIASLLIPAFKVTSPFLTAKAPSRLYSYPASVTPIKTWGVGETFHLIYAVGIALFLARFIFHMLKLYFVVKRYGAQKVNGLKIVSIDKDFSPFSFLNFLFINDRHIPEHNMRRIIAHENIHIKQHHSFDILLIELVTIFQWFNPFVWPYKKSLQETHEFLADNGVIAQGFSTAKYQLLMFEQHVGLKLFEFANNFKQSQIKRRITMISKIKSRGTAKLKLLLMIPLASLLVLALAEPKPASPQVGEALGADMVGIKINNNTITVNADQEDEAKKQKQVQAEKELKTLILKEKDLRTQLDSTKDAEKRAELKSMLVSVLEKKEVIESFLSNGQLPPPPAPPKHDQAQNDYQLLLQKEEALKAKLEIVKDAKEKEELIKSLKNVSAKRQEIQAYLESNGGIPAPPAPPAPPPAPAKLEEEYKMLSEKADVIRARLDETKDADKRSELKAMLVEVTNKQEKIKTYLAESNGANGSNGPSIDELKKEYAILSEKEAKIKQMLADSKDPEQKAELKQNLKNVQERMELIKAKAESLKKEGRSTK